MPPLVTVGLSTFNGERYLAQQLDSLVEQSYRNIEIRVRDDGSVDDSRQIVERYSARYGNIDVACGERLGIAGSFLRLMREGQNRCDYFAFCDQDDVWYADKVQRAVDSLSQLPGRLPGLYCSRLEYVDQGLRHIGYSRIPRVKLSFANALVENRAVGCTVVLNRPAIDLLLDSLPDRVVMHDWWAYLVVSAFGKVLYDERPSVKYRLHSVNQVGAPRSAADVLVRRVRRFVGDRENAFPCHRQALEFLATYGTEIADDERRLLTRFIGSKRSWANRLRFALAPGVYRQSRLDNMMLRALIVAGWY